MENLRIDPEFQEKIPPLTEAEFQQLKENILADGEVYEPIAVWNGVIVDGHNRWKIIQEHPEIPHKVKEMDFQNKWEAFAWMYKKQLGRRNLKDDEKTYLMGKRNEAEKMAVGAPSKKVQNGPLREKGKTAQKIAEEYGVGYGTVIRAEQFAKGVDAVREVDPEAADKILSGKANITKTEVQKLAKADQETVKEAVQAIKENRHSNYFLPDDRNNRKPGHQTPPPEPTIPTDQNWKPEFELDDLLEEARGVTGNFMKQIQRVMRDNRKMVADNLAEVTIVLDEVINGLEKLKEEF